MMWSPFISKFHKQWSRKEIWLDIIYNEKWKAEILIEQKNMVNEAKSL